MARVTSLARRLDPPQQALAYRLTFGNAPHVLEVLRDLAAFCRASETTFDADARWHALLEGRREVWIRITRHLHLTDAQIVALTTGRPIQLTEEE